MGRVVQPALHTCSGNRLQNYKTQEPAGSSGRTHQRWVCELSVHRGAGAWRWDAGADRRAEEEPQACVLAGTGEGWPGSDRHVTCMHRPQPLQNPIVQRFGSAMERWRVRVAGGWALSPGGRLAPLAERAPGWAWRQPALGCARRVYFLSLFVPRLLWASARCSERRCWSGGAVAPGPRVSGAVVRAARLRRPRRCSKCGPSGAGVSASLRSSP